jgi:O-antigen ligase
MIAPLAAGSALANLHRDRRHHSTLREKVLWVSSPAATKILLTCLAVAVMALTLVLTLSRSGIGCLIFVLLIIGTVVARRSRMKMGKRITLACLALILLASFSWVGIERIAAEFLHRGPNGSTLGDRHVIWQDTLEIIRDFPLVGTGFNTYRTAMLQYETPRTYSSDEAHNDYLQLLAEGGLLLAAAVLTCIGLFVATVRRRFREQGSEQPAYWIRVGAVAGLMGIALQETVEFSLQIPGNSVMFCFLAAVALSHLEGEPPAKAKPTRGKPKLELAIAIGTTVVAVASGVIAYRISGPYGESAADRRIHRIYDVPAKRLTQLFYDKDGNGIFDVWIDLRNPASTVIEKDSNEDGIPESRERFETRSAQR